MNLQVCRDSARSFLLAANDKHEVPLSAAFYLVCVRVCVLCVCNALVCATVSVSVSVPVSVSVTVSVSVSVCNTRAREVQVSVKGTRDNGRVTIGGVTNG